MAREEYDDKNDVDAADDAAIEKHAEKARRQLSRGRFTQLTEKLTGGPERPGEQKIGRSPIVLGLAGLVIGSLVVAAIFYARNADLREERKFDEAVKSLEEQRYLDAEPQFSKFIANHPKSKRLDAARIGELRTIVEKYLITKFPDVIKGHAALDKLINDGKQLAGFDEIKADIARYADRLTYAGAVVAEVTQEQAPLDASIAAMNIMERFSGKDGIPPSRLDQLQRMQRLASASVAKKTEFRKREAEIRGLLGTGKTIDAIGVRDRLLVAFPGLSDDKDLTTLLKETLDKERELTVRSEGGNALTTDPNAGNFKSLALTLRTQAVTDLSSQGRLVFGFGIDSVVAADSDTGDPIWRRPVGIDAPFAPIAIKGTEPGVLVFSTLANELLLLSQKDGKLLWRQPMEGLPNATPLVVSDTIFVTTDKNELWQVAVANGRALSRLKFTQPIIGPPTLASDGSKLVIAGDETLVYTLSINPLSCIAVSQIPHQAGSVKAPILAAGKYFLMCDNITAAKARIQTLTIDDNGVLAVASSDPIDGQVNDPCLLRGYDLFVPSTPQRVTAFRVTEEIGQPPLSRVGANQLEDGLQTEMFLLAGPSGQLWLGGRDLRKFQTRTNTVLLDSGVTAVGVHLQPILFADEAVFLTTRNPQASSVFFTRANREEMKGTWRTVLGSRLVAVGAAATGDSMLAVTDFGEMFRVSMTEIANGGFKLESTSRLQLPQKLASPLGGVALKDGRLAAWCGAPEPTMWTFTPTGQFEEKWRPLPDAATLPPVALEGAAVFAMSGRLHVARRSSETPAEDYQAAQTGDQQQPWKSLTVISPTQVLAVTSDNKFIRVEYRPTPRPQLAELSVTNVPYVIELPPAVSGEFLFLATTDGKIVMMQASTLEVLAEADLGIIPSAQPKVAGSFVFVELANREVRVFKVEDGLPPAATFQLEGHALAGDPLLLPDNSSLIARTDGAIIRMNSDGTISDSIVKLGQSIQQGPLSINGKIIVIAVDGSLYQLDSDIGKQ